MTTVSVAEDVVTPEGHQDSKRTDRQQGVNVLPLYEKYHAQDRQGDAAKAGR